MGQTNRRPRVWCSKYYFLYTFYRLRALKILYFYFCNLIKNSENKLQGFLQRILQEILKKNNSTWNIRCLVDNSFVPLSKQPSILYCKLTDFRSAILHTFSPTFDNAQLLRWVVMPILYPTQKHPHSKMLLVEKLIIQLEIYHHFLFFSKKYKEVLIR